jgi:hypothetical protein
MHATTLIPVMLVAFTITLVGHRYLRRRRRERCPRAND